jgi:WhiB family redox-sensing transcriptional regulator
VSIQTLQRTFQVFQEPWQVRAACRGPETWLFFPPAHPERKDEREEREARAKAICARCPVRADCLDFAVRTREPYGIWGGLTELERQQLVASRS